MEGPKFSASRYRDGGVKSTRQISQKLVCHYPLKSTYRGQSLHKPDADEKSEAELGGNGGEEGCQPQYQVGSAVDDFCAVALG